MVRTLSVEQPGTPDSRGPRRYLWWLVIRQWRLAAPAAVVSVGWMFSLILPPYFISTAIDDGLRRHDIAALAGWGSAIVGVGLASALIGLLRHRLMTFIRTDASYRTVAVVIRHAVRLGATFPSRVSAGEVVSIGGSDVSAISEAQTFVGPGFAALITYGAVAFVLFGVSPQLAVVALLGVPVIALAVGPLLSRLRRTQTDYRSEQGALTARAGDIVSGLRVLCGIGGKPLFARRYREASEDLRAKGYLVGTVTSWIDALSGGLPGIFLAVITWLAAHEAVAGQITVGQLVAVYGYVGVLIVPVGFLIESVQQFSRGLVAARRVTKVLNLAPAIADGHGAGPAGPADLLDPDSGLRLIAGRTTALVTAQPADAVALVDRLGRYTDSAVTWGGRPMGEVSLAEVRRRILVADNDAYLFAGALREVVHTAAEHSDAEIGDAFRLAAARDVLVGLPSGMGSTIQARAANLSGGQRQRLRLVRALLADPEVLLLVEPTSAVDAHTESLIAQRVGDARKGKTTLLVGTSPLLLDRADEVVFLVDGKVAATGPHARLLRDQADYRALVFRGESEGDADDSAESAA
ncbi:MAG TPA: ABC transporter ATP-binding protein [Pseudonocardiaceae bacterium]|nr:ABC transporter ATP-binding protein [Pseudonocardiaceae bacterium]